ncbi:MAG: hypothetical protein AUJ57_00460 [Zetaproteobacteria bacterium CG1_02_53_45]|nr:MAG: hypothetical protein AUJ57_00460 [Zetaproteobacteria bacterium CG1_02_53_45]
MTPALVNLPVWVVQLLRRSAHFILALCLLLSASYPSLAHEQQERRLQIALNLFPNVISLDQQLEQKLDPQGRLHLLLVYDHHYKRTETLRLQLAGRIDSIRKIPVVFSIATISELTDARDVAAVFIADTLDDDMFTSLLETAVQRKIIIFSPHPGDVERGATIGLSISSKILPYYNAATIQKSTIKFHPMFLNVAKRYEE